MPSHHPGKYNFARKKYRRPEKIGNVGNEDSRADLGLESVFELPETEYGDGGITTSEERLALDSAREILRRAQEQHRSDSS